MDPPRSAKREEQDNEFLALEAILGDAFCPAAEVDRGTEAPQASTLAHDTLPLKSGVLSLAPALPPDVVLAVPQGFGTEPVFLPLRHFPALHLSFTLPADYPGVPPTFEIDAFWLGLDPSWKPRLRAHLLGIWKIDTDGPCLFQWASWLKEEDGPLELLGLLQSRGAVATQSQEFPRDCVSHALKGTGDRKTVLTLSQDPSRQGDAASSWGPKQLDASSVDSASPLKTSSSRPPSGNSSLSSEPASPSPYVRPAALSDVVNALIRFDETKGSEVFNASLFLCEVCQYSHLGSESFEFPRCRHVFCRECLKRYYEDLVGSNKAALVGCPSMTCVSAMARAETETDKEALWIPLPDLKELLGHEGFRKWEKALKRARIEAEKDVSWCPRRGCHLPGLPGKTEEKLVICQCGFTYCRLCLQVWHGIAPCRIRETHRVVVDYLEALETHDSLKEKQLVFRYGLKTLEKLVKDYKEQSQSLAWIKSNTKPCPTCAIGVEKIDGCNHMKCSCGTHFCFLCGAWLHGNPYQHYNQPSSPCYALLFFNTELEGAGEVAAEAEGPPGEEALDEAAHDELAFLAQLEELNLAEGQDRPALDPGNGDGAVPRLVWVLHDETLKRAVIRVDPAGIVTVLESDPTLPLNVLLDAV